LVKTFKHRLCLVATISLLIIVSGIFSYFPHTQAKELTVEEKSLQLLNDVANIDISSYSAGSRSQQQDSFLTLPMQTTDFTLSSEKSSMRIRCSFIGNQLQKIYITDHTGEISLNSKTSNIIDDAKGFLHRYQTYTNNKFYGNLQSMLESIDIGENASRIDGNVKLRVNVYEQARTEIVWTYVDVNGVEAPVKNTAISYQNGVLKSFVDNWQFYTIAGEPEISREQAVDMVLSRVANLSYTSVVSGENVSVSGFNVASVGEASLCYLNNQDADRARGSDPFTLYPSWFVPLGFDKFYPGGVTGVYVRFWADTGELCDVVPMTVDAVSENADEIDLESGSADTVDTNDLNVNDALENSVLFVPVIAIVGAFFVCFCLRWRKSLLSGPSLAKKSFRPLTVVMCFLILASLVLVSVPKAEAYVTGSAGALIFGSKVGQFTGTVQINDPYNIWHGEHDFEEEEAVGTVTSTVYSHFDEYDGRNRYFGFNKNQMLAAILSAESNYDNVAVLYIGHRVSDDSYLVEGSFLAPVSVTSGEIDQRTTGKAFFIWSWTCDSANSHYSGLPVAWTDNKLNDGSRCYIGFEDASPGLSVASFRYSYGLGQDFITSFYYYALELGYSVYYSLDSASWDTFGQSFYDSPLNGGQFQTYWPIEIDLPDAPEPGWHPGYMRVYGNSNIHLTQDPESPPPPPPTPNLAVGAFAWLDELESYQPIPVDFYLNGQLDATGYGHYNPYRLFTISPGTYYIEYAEYTAGDDPLQFHSITWSGGETSERSLWVMVPAVGTTMVSAIYANSLNVSCTYGGATNASECTALLHGESLTVTALPIEGWMLNYWRLDGEVVGGNPTYTFTMDDHDAVLEAVFCQGTPHYQLTVQPSLGGSAILLNETSKFNVGDTATVTVAEVYAGYQFSHWPVDGEYAGSQAQLAITMTANHTVQAHFALVGQGVTVTVLGWFGSDPYVYQEVDVDIYVNGTYLGTTPTEIVLPLGTYTFQACPQSFEEGIDLYSFYSIFTISGAFYPFTFTHYYGTPTEIEIEANQTYIIWYTRN
jgi:hypothetical protein